MIRYCLFCTILLLQLSCSKAVKPQASAPTGHRPWGILGATIYAEDGGQKINRVVVGGSAAKAGVLKGDLITAIDGKKYSETTALIRHIRSTLPGTRVTLSITRGWEQRLKIKVILGTYPQDEQLFQMAFRANEGLDAYRAKKLMEKLLALYPLSKRKDAALRFLKKATEAKKTTLSR